MFFLRILFFVVFIFLFSGCLTFKNLGHENNWSEYYQKIIHPKSQIFINEAYLNIQSQDYELDFLVNTINLYRSKLKPEYKNFLVEENFSLVEVKEENAEEINIYVGVDIDHHNYYFLLAHEVFHLINPYIKDWYMEGQATLFAKNYCLSKNLLDKNWINILNKKENKRYLASYNLIKEIKSIVPNDYKKMVHYTMRKDDSKWLSIDIDKWIDSLELNKKIMVINVIKKYENILVDDTSTTFSSPSH